MNLNEKIKFFYKSSRTSLGALVILFGLLFFLCPIIVLAFTELINPVVGLACFLIGGICISIGRRMVPPYVDSISHKDSRAPILYIRSFKADEDWTLFSFIKGIFTSALTKQPVYSREEQLCAVLSHLGPIIAVGRPGEKLTPVGFSRVYLDNDNWQTFVLDEIIQAQIVVIAPGLTEGFWWEFERVIKNVAPTRILIDLRALGKASKRQIAYDAFRKRAIHFIPTLPKKVDLSWFLWFSADGSYYLEYIPWWFPTSSEKKKSEYALGHFIQVNGYSTSNFSFFSLARRSSKTVFTMAMIFYGFIAFCVMAILILTSVESK